MKSKQELRRLALSRRRAMPEEERAEASRRIAERLFSFKAWKEAGTVYLYFGYGDEVLTESLIERALEEGKRVALPKVKDKENMLFYEITSIKELSCGAYGIPEPSEEAAKRDYDLRPELIIAPCVGIDTNGNRIGHGRGYYDRFLASYTDIPAYCLAFECQIVESFKAETTDIRIDRLITESRIIDTSKTE